MNQFNVNTVVLFIIYVICIIYVVVFFNISNSTEAAVPNILKIHFLPELDLPLKKEGRMTRKKRKEGRGGKRGGEREGGEGGWRERGTEGRKERKKLI